MFLHNNVAVELFTIAIIIFIVIISPGESRENIALGKPAYMSSQRNRTSPDKAVDGNTNGYFQNQSCAHTEKLMSEHWWVVDLQGVYTIESIVLYNRVDCCSHRLREFELKVISEDKTTEKMCKNFTGVQNNSMGTYICNEPVSGRYVMVNKTSNKTEQLALCEVEVYEYPRQEMFTILRHKGSLWLESYGGQRHGQMLTNCARRRLRDDRYLEELPYVQIDLADGGCRFLVNEMDSDESQSEDWVLLELH